MISLTAPSALLLALAAAMIGVDSSASAARLIDTWRLHQRLPSR